MNVNDLIRRPTEHVLSLAGQLRRDRMLPTWPIRDRHLEALPSKSIFINWRCSLQNIDLHLSWDARFKWRHPPSRFASTCMRVLDLVTTANIVEMSRSRW